MIDCYLYSVQRKIKAADLIERVHTEVDVYEKDYFALYFIENNQKVSNAVSYRRVYKNEGSIEFP